MHVRDKSLNKFDGGVDLNRNYGFKFGVGNSAPAEGKGDTFRGPSAFSEPETRAMRDWITSKKDELSFVMNFHCAGKKFIIPYNGVFPNTLAAEHPKVKQFFDEMVREAKFPEDTDIGPASSTLGFQAGGSAGDWIAHEIGIPAGEAELGSWRDYAQDWVPHTT